MHLFRLESTRRLFFPSAVTLRALWLQADFLILCHVKPTTSFWSTVLQPECERREMAGEETERWITNFWNWYGNLVTCSIPACRLEVLELRNTCGRFRVLLTRINTAGAAFAKCHFVFVWAFSAGKTRASFKVDFLPSCGKVSWKLLAFFDTFE